MATVYSMVCFGGRTGKTVTFTDSGDVVNLATHGLRQGATGVVFSTTGSLPTGITAGTTYYTRNGADAGKFTIYPTKADAVANTNQVTFSGTGSSCRVNSAYLYGLTTEQKARYGSAGSERIYDSIISVQGGLSALLNGALSSDTYVVEFPEAFTDLSTAGSINLRCKSLIFTSMVNGSRGAGYHYGHFGDGFILSYVGTGTGFTINSPNFIVDGLQFHYTGTGASAVCISYGSLAIYTEVKNNLFYGTNTSYGTGISSVGLTAGDVHDNILIGFKIGIYIYGQVGSKFHNNILAKNNSGFYAEPMGGHGQLFNNISVGNGDNYANWPGYGSFAASNNYGESTDVKTATVVIGTSTKNVNITAHGRILSGYSPVIFKTTGTLPAPIQPNTVYFVYSVPNVNTITISLYPGSSEITFTTNGTGTHTVVDIVTSDTTYKILDVVTNSGNNLFVDYANNDFRPATNGTSTNPKVPNAGALQVNTGMIIDGGRTTDLLDAERPGYDGTAVKSNWDGGALQFDYGMGIAPQTITITNLAAGSIVKLARVDTGAVLGTGAASNGTASIAVGYSGAVTVEARCASAAPYYKPWITQITIPDTLAVIALQDLDQ